MFRGLPSLPIYMMTSFARSGETLLQRCLNAHPDVLVLHQIYQRDHDQDRRLFQKIRRTSKTKVRPPFGMLKRKGGGRVLLVKHGVWNHRWPYNGFVFVRNPFATTASLLRYSIDRNETEYQARKRIGQWARGIDPSLSEMCATGDIAEATTRLYLAKMQHAVSAGHSLVRYEDFVSDPRSALAKICGVLGVEWHEGVLTSELSYRKDEVGHGGIKLSEPIRSAPVYTGGLTDRQFEMVAEITAPVLDVLGYRTEGSRVEMVPAGILKSCR